MSDKPVSYSDVMRELSNMVGEYFENIEDVEAYCAELRGGSDQNKLTDLRAQRDKALATVSRLREIIRKVEWVKQRSKVGIYCLHCAMPKDRGHHEHCPFYQWEGGAK